MAAKKSSSSAPGKRPQAGKSSLAYQRLYALLHTVRCIAQYEDVLCELTHELKTSGELTPAATAELRRILEKIPSDDFVADVDGVRAVLMEQQPVAKREPKPSKKSVRARK